MHQVAFLRTVFLALAIAPLIGNGNEARADFDGTYAVTYSGTVTITTTDGTTVRNAAGAVTATVENGTITGITGTGTVSAAGVVNGYLTEQGVPVTFEGAATLLETGGVEMQGTWSAYANDGDTIVDGFGTWTATRITDNNVRALKRGLNIDEFIKQYKKILKINLSPTDEVNLRKLLTFMQNDPSIHFEQDVRQAAYMLATARGECNYLPRYEKHSGISAYSYFERKYGFLTRKGKELGNTKLGDGYLYRGRGYVQITGKNNYAKFDFFLGEDLVANPDLALQPVIAYDILSFGLFDGMFTGVGLDRFITDTKTDYLNARKVVNSLDKATQFRNYALQFEKVLKASVIGF